MIPARHSPAAPANGEVRTGRDISVVIENMPYADPLGRETVTLVRTFDLPGRSRGFAPRTVPGPRSDRSLVVREETRA
ncbi:uncharacterized protein DUF4166 [Streptomyces sp. BK340]|nr:DUF4166 domain-containing protein [Streptomyces sp. BK340]TVZ85348.1 uncharacterized protein DUF4166 [Streptomyces sp. BK340]